MGGGGGGDCVGEINWKGSASCCTRQWEGAPCSGAGRSGGRATHPFCFIAFKKKEKSDIFFSPSGDANF